VGGGVQSEDMGDRGARGNRGGVSPKHEWAYKRIRGHRADQNQGRTPTQRPTYSY